MFTERKAEYVTYLYSFGIDPFFSGMKLKRWPHEDHNDNSKVKAIYINKGHISITSTNLQDGFSLNTPNMSDICFSVLNDKLQRNLSAWKTLQGLIETWRIEIIELDVDPSYMKSVGDRLHYEGKAETITDLHVDIASCTSEGILWT